MLATIGKGVFHDGIIARCICHEIVVVAATVATHIHIILFEHLYSLFDGRSPVEQHSDCNRRIDFRLAGILACLFLVQSQHSDGKAVLVDAVECGIRQTHQQRQVGFFVRIESLPVIQLQAVHHRNRPLAAFGCCVYENCRDWLVTLIVGSEVAEIVIAPHQKVGAVGLRHCKCAASRTKRHVACVSRQFVVKQRCYIAEESGSLRNARFQHLVQLIIDCIIDLVQTTLSVQILD